jgi:photosystem II stability/assembly factor-like uncharacterized protein
LPGLKPIRASADDVGMPSMNLRGPWLALPLALAAAIATIIGCGDSVTTAPPNFVPLDSLTVSPSSATIQVNESLGLTVTAVDTSGAHVNNPSVLFHSTNTGVARVSGSGVVTGVAEGTALVIAESSGLSDTSTIVVLPATTGWFGQTTGTSAVLNAVFFLPDGNSGWAVGVGGKMIATSNAGVTWSPRTSNTAFTLNGVWFTTSAEGWAVGANGTIMHSTDGGSVWSRVDAATSENLTDVVFTARDTGFVVGSNGIVLRTTDRGVNWSKQFPTASTLRGIAFARTLDGWAVGDGGVIVGTHDAGADWFVVQPSVTAQSLRSVVRRSFETSYAVGDQGVTPRTVVTADSVAWELRNAGAANQLEDVFFVSDLVGFAVGFNGTGIVLRTDDGGVTWTPQIANSAFALNGVFFVDTHRGWAVGSNGRVIHTVTGGQP